MYRSIVTCGILIRYFNIYVCAFAGMNNKQIKCVYLYSLRIYFWEISCYQKIWARYDDHKCILAFIVKYPSFLSDFSETWIFLTDFRNILRCKIHEIRPVGAVLFHAGRHTDMTKLVVANAPKNCAFYPLSTRRRLMCFSEHAPFISLHQSRVSQPV